MTRRTAAVLVLAVAALAGCSDTRADDAAAEVEGTAVARDDYEDFLEYIVANPELFGGVQEDFATGTIPGDAGRQFLTTLVIDAATQEFLSGAGEEITDADRQAILESVPQNDPARDLPPEVLDLFVGLQAATAARGRIEVDAAELERRYNESPTGTGVMCVRHIVVESEDEAQDILDELADGADFAELAAERSTEPAAAETGGALTAQDGSACIPLPQAAQTFDRQFVEGALAARPGVSIGPVETSFGWHVIQARPWEEVEESITALYEQAGGDLGFVGYLATADIDVDPRYGRWDPIGRSVVAL